MRIVFMGTPDYSVKTLKSIIEAGHEVVGVFAQPDKPVGRKQVLTPPPVKQTAQELNIPVYQPATLRDGKALEILKSLNPELIVVVAYGKILPKEILNFPKYGCINGHASLLPKYRGASPIQWAILCGEKETGVTIMYMDEGMDTGDIIDTVHVPIGDDMTAEELFENLSEVSAELTVKTIKSLENGTAVRKKQDEKLASYAPIIKKEMARIDFNKNSDEVHNAIRGFYSWPCSFFFVGGKRIKVIKSRVSFKTDAKPATVIESDEKLVIACGNGTSIELITVQPEGSRAMSASQWLCGHNIPVGTTVGE